MRKFEHIKRKLILLFGRRIYEKEEKEEIKPLPNYREEEVASRINASLSSGIVGIPCFQFQKEEKTSKNERWDQKVSSKKKRKKRDRSK